MLITGIDDINILKEVKKMAPGLLEHGLAVWVSREDNAEFIQR